MRSVEYILTTFGNIEHFAQIFLLIECLNIYAVQTVKVFVKFQTVCCSLQFGYIDFKFNKCKTCIIAKSKCVFLVNAVAFIVCWDNVDCTLYYLIIYFYIKCTYAVFWCNLNTFCTFLSKNRFFVQAKFVCKIQFFGCKFLSIYVWIIHNYVTVRSYYKLIEACRFKSVAFIFKFQNKSEFYSCVTCSCFCCYFESVVFKYDIIQIQNTYSAL